jgi:hypothetical protein
MTDFRALCSELFEIVEDEYSGTSCLMELRSRAQAALAQPEPQVHGPTDEQLAFLYYVHCGGSDAMGQVGFEDAARTVLARWGRPAIEPVPVSERLPGPGDCDAEGRCWWWNPTMDPDCPNWWSFESTEYIETEPYWLPHWALPVPVPEAHNG